MAYKKKEKKNPFLTIILVITSLTFVISADLSLNIDFTVEKITSTNNTYNQPEKSSDNRSINNYKFQLNAGANGDGQVDVVKDIQ